jgi:RNA polymerase primary sigma factor
MPEREQIKDRTTPIPEHLVESILKLSRTSRQMLQEIGRESSAEELAEKLAMPLEKVRKVLLAKQPIRLRAPIFDEEGSHQAQSRNIPG